MGISSVMRNDRSSIHRFSVGAQSDKRGMVDWGEEAPHGMEMSERFPVVGVLSDD
jgi:predicted heme/steroid binding protein